MGDVATPAAPPPRGRAPPKPPLLLVPPAVRVLIELWETYQVELQGSYSVARLHDLVTHYKDTNMLQAIATCLLTPVPCIVAIVLADVLPLQPPAEGLSRQGTTYWVRTYFSVVVITITSMSQFYHASSRLPLRVLSAVLATLAVTTVTATFILGLHLLVGFPTPFLYQFTSGFWQFLLFSSMWVLWHKTLRTDADAHADMKRFIWCWLSQVTMIVVYPIFSYVFSTLSGRQQTVFSFVLPVWKLALKLWASYGVFRVEDAAPVYVVFTVDVFHALFLSSAMQSSTSTGSGTLVVTMLVDAAQACAAVNDVRVLCSRLQRLGKKLDALETKAATSSSGGSRLALFRAEEIVSTHASIKDHPLIAGSRHQRANDETQATASSKARGVWFSRTNRTSVARVYVTSDAHQGHDGDVHGDKPRHPPTAGPDTSSTTHQTPLDRTRLQYAREALRLLHMVEFYVLIEFTEVLVAVVYSIYLVIMSQLPNRVYYAQLRAMSDAQWVATVQHVVLYAGLELLSFVLLCLACRRLLGHSPVRQLAFVLQKHWRLVQSLLVLWVFFVIQMSLEHLGTDYTFRFAWVTRSRGGGRASDRHDMAGR